jgi:hypothetical protein
MITQILCSVPQSHYFGMRGRVELMDRMGHSSTRAALIYQHRSKQRDKRLADAISARVSAERIGHATGTPGQR